MTYIMVKHLEVLVSEPFLDVALATREVVVNNKHLQG